jgi:outer membrane receptor protein involved in Fe transport
MNLVERVEVLTGGASAIYGADAVTGVVNFILMDNYEGFGVDVNYGVSAQGDGQQTALTATWGTNFADDRGNVVISVDYRTDDGLLRRERPGEFYGTAGPQPNPELRFQTGDIDAAATPNLAQFYDFSATGLFDYGLPIPDTADFIANYNATFGMDPVLTSAETALFNRAASAFPRAILPQFAVPITSGYGVIIPGNPFTFAGFDPLTPIDLDNNASIPLPATTRCSALRHSVWSAAAGTSLPMALMPLSEMG